MQHYNKSKLNKSKRQNIYPVASHVHWHVRTVVLRKQTVITLCLFFIIVQSIVSKTMSYSHCPHFKCEWKAKTHRQKHSYNVTCRQGLSRFLNWTSQCVNFQKHCVSAVPDGAYIHIGNWAIMCWKLLASEISKNPVSDILIMKPTLLTRI